MGHFVSHFEPKLHRRSCFATPFLPASLPWGLPRNLEIAWPTACSPSAESPPTPTLPLYLLASLPTTISNLRRNSMVTSLSSLMYARRLSESGPRSHVSMTSDHAHTRTFAHRWRMRSTTQSVMSSPPCSCPANALSPP